jgi:transposase-like protein
MYKNDRETKRYSEPFKLKILSELSIGKHNKCQLGKLYGIAPKTIYEWIKKCILHTPWDTPSTKPL